MSHGKALVLLVFLVGQGWVFADKASARFDAVPGSRYTSARGAALGDAYLPLADDGASALFYNPAAIARLKDFHFEPMNIQLGVNSDYTNSLTYQDFFKAYSLQNFKDTLADHQGRFAEIGAQYAPVLCEGFCIWNDVQVSIRGKAQWRYRRVSCSLSIYSYSRVWCSIGKGNRSFGL